MSSGSCGAFEVSDVPSEAATTSPMPTASLSVTVWARTTALICDRRSGRLLTLYWLWVSDFVDPAECEQSDRDTGSQYRYNDFVTLTTKKPTVYHFEAVRNHRDHDAIALPVP